MSLRAAAVPVLLLVFGALFYWSAYVCDDAFITFRTVDNLVRGHGLRWNAMERVQSFTSPLFLLLVSAAYWPVHDAAQLPNPGRIYWVAITLSFALSGAALLWLWKSSRGAWFWLVFALLMSSQAFVTFTSSGLETPLTYLLLVVFFTGYLRGSDTPTTRQLFGLLLVAALGVLSRLDAALLFLPACVELLIRGWRGHGARIAVPIALASVPLVAWLAFSLVYFGFLFPNTYYAKAGLDVDPAILHTMGFDYLKAGLLTDPVTLLGIGAGAILALVRARTALVAAGALLYVFYVWGIGGDFIGHRFLAPPFLVAAVAGLHSLEGRFPRSSPGWAAAGVVALLLYGALVPHSPLRAFRDGPQPHDVRFYYPASALSEWRPGARFPYARFLYVDSERTCRRLRTEAFVVAVWGDGLNAFCRGPHSHLVDPHGVTDPLLARLSMPIAERFIPGHLEKPLPRGYVESIVEDANRIDDPALAAYYTRLRRVVSGPLFTRERWRDIAALNLTPQRRYTGPYAALPVVPAWMRREAGRR